MSGCPMVCGAASGEGSGSGLLWNCISPLVVSDSSGGR